MKLIKLINGSFDIKDAEGEEAKKLIAEGYELACETDKPSEDAECLWQRIENGYVQVWLDNHNEDEDTNR